MRLSYIDATNADAFQNPSEAAIVNRMRARRAPRPLQPLDLTLLHAPAVADGWNSFLGAIRTGTSLSDDVREIAICRVAVLNGAWYEWAHHAPLAREGGVSEEGMRILGKPDFADEDEDGNEDEGSGLTGRQWAVVGYTDAMTRDVAVSQGVFDALRQHFSEQQIVELTATVSSGYAFCYWDWDRIWAMVPAVVEHKLIRAACIGCRVQLCQ
jgi:alkylhydroperoxidase family enzyme